MGVLVHSGSVEYTNAHNGLGVPIAWGPGLLVQPQSGLSYSIDSASRTLSVRLVGSADQPVQQIALPPSWNAVVQTPLGFATIDGREVLLVNVSQAGTFWMLEVQSDGRLGSPQSVSLGREDIHAWAEVPGFGLAVANASGTVTLWREGPDGNLTATDTAEIGLRIDESDLRALTVSTTGSATYIAVLSGDDNSVTSLRINSDGSLTEIQELEAMDGMPASGLHKMISVALDGQTYLLVLGAGSSSVTVLHHRADGFLIPVDQVNDTRDLRFDDATTLETFVTGDRVFVLAAGSDDGLTLMTLMPGGRLLHVDTIAGDLLQGVGAFTVQGGADTLAITATRADGTGQDILTLDIADLNTGILEGQNVTGTAGDDLVVGQGGHATLLGLAGDDILIDGTGSDTLDGGAGADVFIFGVDNSVDYIRNFELGIDRIDISQFGRFYTLDAVEITARADGAEIVIGNETLIIQTAENVSLSASDFTLDDLVDPLWHVSVEAADDVPRFEMGDLGDNRVIGGAQNDTLYGGGGSDQLIGLDGNDILFGSAPDLERDEINAQVFRLYQATLGRAPDLGGLSYWSGILREGTQSLTEVVAGFTGSVEFMRTYGGLNNTEFVTVLYNNVLGRDPDAVGLASWVNALNADVLSRAEVVTGFSESAEFQANTAIEALGYSYEAVRTEWSDDVFRLYQATLARSPDIGGFNYWIDTLAGGQDFNQVIFGFVNSAEFTQRYGSTSGTEFVTLLYNNVLDRAPDASGLASWTDLLNSGTSSRADVVRGFAQSAEFIQRSNPDFKTYLQAFSDTDMLEGGKGNDIWWVALVQIGLSLMRRIMAQNMSSISALMMRWI